MAARIVRMGKGKPTPYDGLVRPTARGEPAWTGEVAFVHEKLADPLRWKNPRRIFVNSMSDLFNEKLTNEQIAAVFGVMAACPQHTFQVLTKRARRMREWFEWAAAAGNSYDLLAWEPRALLACAWEACSGDAWGDAEPDPLLGDLPSHEVFGSRWPISNVWLGVSVESQDAADERIPELLATPAAVRFLSCEPLLGEIDLIAVQELVGDPAPRIDWVIAGCESGPGARQCSVGWLRSLRDQCAAAGVPFFLKQAVEHNDDRFWEVEIGGDDFMSVQAGPGSTRKPGGVIELPYLDGVQYAAFPEAAR